MNLWIPKQGHLKQINSCQLLGEYPFIEFVIQVFSLKNIPSFVANLLRVRTLLVDHLSGGVLSWLKTQRLHLKILIGSYMMKTAVKGEERKGNKFSVYLQR
jgi:hypothetical protein